MDTTGLGIRYAKIGESVLLLETSDSASFSRSERFSRDNVMDRRDGQCVIRMVVAEDKLGNVYHLPLRIKGTFADYRITSGGQFNFQCQFDTSPSC